MNEKTKDFSSNNITYKIIETSHDIIIQIKKNYQIEVEKYYIYKDFNAISNYFYLFTSIHEIAKEITSLAEMKKIACIENNTFYELILTINFKDITTIKLIIPKEMTNPQLKIPSNANANEQDNNKYNELNFRLNKLENQINDSTDKIISELSKKMYCHISMIESKYEKQIKEIVTHVTNTAIQNEGYNKEINNSNITQVVTRHLNDIEIKVEKQIKALNKRVDNTIKTIEEKSELKQRTLSREKSVKSNTSTDYPNHKLCSPSNIHKSKIDILELSNMRQSKHINATYQSPHKNLCELNNYMTSDEKIMLLSWISQIRTKKCHLIYTSNYGKDNHEVCSKAFHSLSPLLILIESDSGKRFGGYTSVSWNDTGKIGKQIIYYAYSIGEYKMDPNAFLFSLNKKKKYLIKQDRVNKALSCKKGTIVSFHNGLWLDEDFMTSSNNWTSLCNYGMNEPRYEMNGGNEYFQVKQMYVYQITN